MADVAASGAVVSASFDILAGSAAGGASALGATLSQAWSLSAGRASVPATGNTSATGGCLSPAKPYPANDAALADVLQSVVSCLSGIPGPLVRPRWQAEPINLPSIKTTWAAIGITDRQHEAFPAIEHQGGDDGFDRLYRHEEFTLLCSFYGPAAEAAAGLVRDGLFIAQNREDLGAAGIAPVSAGAWSSAPEYINERWHERIDMPIYFRRLVVRDYPVLNLLSAGLSIQSDTGLTIERIIENG